MTSPISPTSSNQEIFHYFFDCWIGQLERDLRPLYATLSSSSNITGDDAQTRVLIDRIIGHYEYYNRAKTALARTDVLPMFTPTWTSSTDNLFIWVGGFRPSTAIHVLYSKSGTQMETHLEGLSAGITPAEDLAALSYDQMEKIDTLKRETVRREREVSEEEAAAQESVGSTRMVEISHSVTEAMLQSVGNGGLVEGALEEDMKERRVMMSKVLEKADALRFETLKSIVEILTPLQSVHFLIAAFELILRVHEVGKSNDFAAKLRMSQRTKSSLF